MLNRVSALIRKCFEFCKRSLFLSVFLIPIVVATPPVVLSWEEHFPAIKALFAKHFWLKVLFGAWPLLLVPLAYIDRKVSRSVSLEQLLLLVKLLARIVGRKYAAIVECLKPSQPNPKEALFRAAKPEQQIADITDAVWMFFDQVRNDRKADVRVSLARMGPQHIEAFEAFSPTDRHPRSSVESLRCHDSCFSTAKREREIVIVEDIAREVQKPSGRRFARTQGAEGGIICYPIWDEVSKDIPLVLSICTSVAGEFKQSHRGIYVYILEQFAQRIMLEYQLKNLKCLVEGKHESQNS